MNLDDQKFLTALGERLHAARTAAGLTQEQLAAKTRLHRTFIGSVERGERNVSVLNLRLLSEKLRVGLNSIMEGLS